MESSHLARKRTPAQAPSLNEAAELFSLAQENVWNLIAYAGRVRAKSFGDHVHLCAILNARSGGCSEDCAFCAQSAHHRSRVEKYPLVSMEKALEAARNAASWGVRCFSLVTSGAAVRGKKERRETLRIVGEIRSRTGLEVAASLGSADLPFLKELKDAGLSTYHHNIETAPSFFTSICSTHGFEERLKTLHAARDAGLTVCSGGIFGLGETPRQRAEFALLLRELEVNRVPVNFLHPIPGTPLEDMPLLRPTEALHILAALRILLPEQDILVCGGRETALRSLQPLLFLAGANGMMVGNYLTTAGPGFERDRQMLDDLHLTWAGA